MEEMSRFDVASLPVRYASVERRRRLLRRTREEVVHVGLSHVRGRALLVGAAAVVPLLAGCSGAVTSSDAGAATPGPASASSPAAPASSAAPSPPAPGGSRAPPPRGGAEPAVPVRHGPVRRRLGMPRARRQYRAGGRCGGG